MADDNASPSPFGGLGWITGGNTGLTYEQLQQRRAIALALASRQKGFPKNKGEGMTYLGESIGDALQGLGLRMSEKQFLAQQAANRKPVDAAPIAVPADPNDPNAKPVVPAAPQKTSEAPAAVEPAPATTADAAVTPTTMAAATEPQDAPGGAVPDLSQFATAGLTASDFGTPAPAPDFPPTMAQRFAAATDQPLAQVQTPVPPVSVDPNMRAQLSGGGNAINPDTMAKPQLAAFARPSSQPIAAPGTPLPQARPDIQTAAIPPQAAGPQAGPPPLPMGDPRTVGGVRATIAATLARNGWGNNAIGGTDMNVASESGYNPNQRTLHDQANHREFVGTEAEHGHGLYQEGGDNYNKYVAWMGQNHPGAPLNDPKMQTEFLAQNVSPGTVDAMNNAGSPGQAAVQFMTDYLRPAKQYQVARANEYLGGVGRTPDDTRTLAQNAVSDASGNRTGGAPVMSVDPESLAFMSAAADKPAATEEPQQAGGGSDARLLEMMGGRRPGSPFFPTASLGRAGVATDAPQPGLSPMGALDPTASINQRRDAITGAVMDQQQPPTAPEVPQPDPTQSGPSAPTTSGAEISAGSSNPQTVVDMAPAPPMGATAQASGIPLGGYSSVPTSRSPQAPQVPPGQLAPPPTSTIERRPEAPQVGPPEEAPRPLAEPVYPSDKLMAASPNELKARDMLSNPYTRGDPSTAQAAQELMSIGARQRENYNNALLEKYNREKSAWDEQQKILRTQASPAGQREAATGRLELQGKQYDADVKRWLGGQDVNTVYASLDADKAEAAKSNNLLRQAAIAREAINSGIITGLGADQKLNIAKLRAWMTNNKWGGDEASATELFKSAADAMLATGVETIRGGAGKAGLGNRVSPTELDIARGGVGADAAYQLSTIKKLIAQNERDARERINTYEDKIGKVLDGPLANSKARYEITNYETAPADEIKKLLDLDAKKYPGVREHFDSHYGTGAAALEIARAQRAARRTGAP